MKFWENPHFKCLQKEWYAKLRDDGFADAERSVDGEPMLSQFAVNCYRDQPRAIREERAAYFTSLCRLIETAPFDSEADRLILTRHAEGAKYSTISRELEARGLKSHRQTIRFTVRRYEHRWGLRRWRNDQLRSRQMTPTKTPMQDSYSVIVYPAPELPGNYRALIFSKWLRSLRYGNDFFKLVDAEGYYDAYRRLIDSLLAKPDAEVRLAVISDDRDVVLGFSVSRPGILDYVHVHKDFRKQGIGRALAPKGIGTVTHLTRVGMSIWESKMPGVKFNPFV